jgi:hypothetical protein
VRQALPLTHWALVGRPESEDDRPSAQAKQRGCRSVGCSLPLAAATPSWMENYGSKQEGEGKTRRARCFVQGSAKVEAGGAGAVAEARTRVCVRRD